MNEKLIDELVNQLIGTITKSRQSCRDPMNCVSVTELRDRITPILARLRDWLDAWLAEQKGSDHETQ